MSQVEIKEIHDGNLSLLTEFLEKFKLNSLGFFRYFDNRDFECLKNHYTTVVAVKNEEAVGYGHLDSETHIWLGVAVLPEHAGEGIGERIVRELLSRAKKLKIETIRLSVDKDNLVAINLYKKIGFYRVMENSKSYFYEIKT